MEKLLLYYLYRRKNKKRRNIEVLLRYGLVKSKDGKILEINLEGESTYSNPECTFF